MTRGELLIDDDQDVWLVSATRFGNNEIFVCVDRESAYSMARYLITEVGVNAGDNDDFSALRQQASDIFGMNVTVTNRPVWVLKKTPLEELDECCATGSSLPP